MLGTKIISPLRVHLKLNFFRLAIFLHNLHRLGVSYARKVVVDDVLQTGLETLFSACIVLLCVSRI